MAKKVTPTKAAPTKKVEVAKKQEDKPIKEVALLVEKIYTKTEVLEVLKQKFILDGLNPQDVEKHVEENRRKLPEGKYSIEDNTPILL